MVKRPTCPTCHRSFNPDDSQVVMPFCGLRCQQVDLGHWLDESIGLPVELEEGEYHEE